MTIATHVTHALMYLSVLEGAVGSLYCRDPAFWALGVAVSFVCCLWLIADELSREFFNGR